MSSSAVGSMMPFSVSNDSSAATRSSIGLAGRGWWCAAESVLIDRFHVALPQVHVDGVARLAPELVALEPHAVRRLVPAARRVRLDVGDGRDDVDTYHSASSTSHVPRASGMPGRMPVADAHALADHESRRDNVVARVVGRY